MMKKIVWMFAIKVFSDEFKKKFEARLSIEEKKVFRKMLKTAKYKIDKQKKEKEEASNILKT